MGGDFQHSSGASKPCRDCFLVIGGGVAGSTCAIELKRLCPSSKVTLVAPSSSLKAVRDVEQITPLVAVVDVHSRSADEFALEHPGISLVCDEVTHVDADRNQAKLASGGTIAFARCCLATGASPSLSHSHPRVVGIRDTESVANLSKRLADARRVLVVGNGGIALELVQALTSSQAVQIVWAVRDAYVGNTFFDANASAFFLPSLSACGKSREVPIPSNSPPSPTPPRDSPSRLPRVSSSADSGGHNSGNSPVGLDVLHTQPEVSGSPRSLLARGPALGIMDGVKVIPHGARSATDDPARAVAEDEVAASSGPSLGPSWLDALNIPACPTQSGGDSSTSEEDMKSCRQRTLLDIHFECELDYVRDGEGSKGSDGADWPVSATLTNGVAVDCDFVISATGANPNTSALGDEFERGFDGGFVVDGRMRVVRSSTTKAMPAKASRASSSHAEEDKDKSRLPAVRKASVNLAPQESIFAAGDCCCLEWPERESAHWFQMRLWSHAREMGLFTAKCMADFVDELSAGAFDLFVHATRFFGHKVVLLGRFNGQGLGKSLRDFVRTHLVLSSDDDVRLEGGAVAVVSGEDSSVPLQRRHEATKVKTGNSKISGGVQVLVRTSPGAEYIKVILVGGRVRGAMLIGDTGLEETFENLILSGTNVSDVGADLLSVDVDVEDFFD